MESVEFLKEGYYVTLSNRPEKIYKVTAVEPFEFETGDQTDTIFSSVASGAESGFQPIDELEPDDKPAHLFQVLWGVKSSGRYYIKIPTGTNRFGIDTDYDIGYITNEKSPYHSPNPLYLFWTVHDFYPAINFSNTTLRAITPKVWFKGMKYSIEEVKGAELSLAKERAKPITMGGITST